MICVGFESLLAQGSIRVGAGARVRARAMVLLRHAQEAADALKRGASLGASLGYSHLMGVSFTEVIASAPTTTPRVH